MWPSSWAERVAGWSLELRSIDFGNYRRIAAEYGTRFRAFMEPGSDPEQAASWPATWLRPKGDISRGGLTLLLVLALLPLLIMIARISAWPGVLSPGSSGGLLPWIGHQLNNSLSLRNISPGYRDHVLYLLFVPTGAILIALARLTFGIKVLGFRAILISVGFQQSGILPSLLLIAAMVLIVFTIRPALVQLRLPYYAHVAVIMSISVLLLVGALLLAPLFRSELLWGVASFPVIVLGLMAEGIAKTIDRDSGLTALWRTAMTIMVALVLAGISRIPVLRDIAIEFPELLVTEIVLIILIAEFLDLRLLQDWDAKLSGVALPRLFSQESALRVAVVCNKSSNGIISRLGSPSRGGYRKRSLRRIVKTLRMSGHSVKVVAGDMSLLSNLQEFIPPHPTSGQPGGIVLNLAHGVQGVAAVAHVPAMLEMSGLAYTGPTPLGLVVSLDRVVAQAMLREAGIATPDGRVIGDSPDECRGLLYPVVVKPRAALGHKLRVARNREQLLEAVRKLSVGHRQECLVQSYVAGREIEVAIIGNAPGHCLPLVEILPGNEGRVCPAALDGAVARSIRATALAAFKACSCRDYAVVNIRFASSGQPMVLEVETAGVLEQGASFELAAGAAGWTFAELINRIVNVARDRYRSTTASSTMEVVTFRGNAGGKKGGELLAG